MDKIPVWLGAIGALIVIASALGAAVAVYKTKLHETSLDHARETITDMGVEIQGFERRETRLTNDLDKEKLKNKALSDRLTIVEDLLLRREEDRETRANIAALKKSVDETIINRLDAIANKVGV